MPGEVRWGRHLEGGVGVSAAVGSERWGSEADLGADAVTTSIKLRDIVPFPCHPSAKELSLKVPLQPPPAFPTWGTAGAGGH